MRFGVMGVAAAMVVGLVVSLPAQSARAADDHFFTVDYAKADGTIDQGQLQNVSQGGYGPMQNSHWFSQQAGQLSSIGFRQVRIDHVFDDAYYHVVRRDAAGKITYHFGALDKVLLAFAHNDVTPLISLSYTPSALGPTLFGPPTSNEAWAALVSATVTHYKHLGYTGWSWELWNEPDSSDFWTGTRGAVRVDVRRDSHRREDGRPLGVGGR